MKNRGVSEGAGFSGFSTEPVPDDQIEAVCVSIREQATTFDAEVLNEWIMEYLSSITRTNLTRNAIVIGLTQYVGANAYPESNKTALKLAILERLETEEAFKNLMQAATQGSSS